MPDPPTPQDSNSADTNKRPWPMAYIIVAIGLFAFLFNLYLLLTAE